jgi:putative acetyltransferase
MQVDVTTPADQAPPEVSRVTGAKVMIRGPRKRDVPALTELMAGDGVVQGLSVMPFISEYEVERMLQHKDTRYWLVAECGGAPAGWAFIEWGSGRWRRIAFLAIGVGDPFAGSGIGRRLLQAILGVGFGYLDLHKIELVVYVDNIAAIKLYESVGFVHEGTKRGNAIRDGRFVDAHVMSFLRENWQAGAS